MLLERGVTKVQQKGLMKWTATVMCSTSLFTCYTLGQKPSAFMCFGNRLTPCQGVVISHHAFGLNQPHKRVRRSTLTPPQGCDHSLDMGLHGWIAVQNKLQSITAFDIQQSLDRCNLSAVSQQEQSLRSTYLLNDSAVYDYSTIAMTHLKQSTLCDTSLLMLQAVSVSSF